ncbi:MAG: glycosyltransferase family 4 protein [Nocardioides sp.]
MNQGRAVHVVVPEGIGDPLRPSGGNTYDRRLCEGLVATGWSVRTREVSGDWPSPGRESRAALTGALGGAPDGSVVLVDGLVASACPEALVPASRRLRTVVLMHMPLGTHSDGTGREREAATVRATAAVVTTSDWTRRWLVEAYGLDPQRVHVARPGVDPATTATGSSDGRNLLTVGAVTPGKGHDLLVAALARVTDLSWRSVCVGSLTRSPAFVASLRQDIDDAGLTERLQLVGPRTGEDLAGTYTAADVLVHTSRAETYGMVVTEALAHGLPALACDVGGVSEALGLGADGRPPGVLVPAGDAEAFAEVVRCWLINASLRRRLRATAAERRAGLTGWEETVDRVARVLEGVAA